MCGCWVGYWPACQDHRPGQHILGRGHEAGGVVDVKQGKPVQQSKPADAVQDIPPPDQQIPQEPADSSAPRGDLPTTTADSANNVLTVIAIVDAGIVLCLALIPVVTILRRKRARSRGTPRRRTIAAWRDTVAALRSAGIAVAIQSTTGQVINIAGPPCDLPTTPRRGRRPRKLFPGRSGHPRSGIRLAMQRRHPCQATQTLDPRPPNTRTGQPKSPATRPPDTRIRRDRSLTRSTMPLRARTHSPLAHRHHIWIRICIRGEAEDARWFGGPFSPVRRRRFWGSWWGGGSAVGWGRGPGRRVGRGWCGLPGGSRVLRWGGRRCRGRRRGA